MYFDIKFVKENHKLNLVYIIIFYPKLLKYYLINLFRIQSTKFKDRLLFSSDSKTKISQKIPMGNIQSVFKDCCYQDSELLTGQLLNASIKNIKSLNLSECKVCQTQINIKQLTYFSKCKHYFHKKCVSQYVKHCILDDQSKIQCLQQGCQRQLQPYQIQNHSNTLLFTKYLRQEFQTYIGKNSKTTFKCFNNECSNILQKDQNCQTYQCQICNRDFCLDCKSQYHYGVTCQGYQKQRSTQENQKSQPISGQNWKNCPHCQRTFFVNENDIISIYCKCGKRVCSNCGGPDCNCFNCKQLAKTK